MATLNPIVLVEDDLVDALTVKRALAQLGVKNQLVHCQNGEEALEYLKKDRDLLPSLILLDLNMPRMGGFEFLEAFKIDHRSSAIPIVILTTSTEDHDRLQSDRYALAGFMIKPVDYHDFVEMMRTLSPYWSTE